MSTIVVMVIALIVVAVFIAVIATRTKLFTTTTTEIENDAQRYCAKTGGRCQIRCETGTSPKEGGPFIDCQAPALCCG